MRDDTLDGRPTPALLDPMPQPAPRPPAVLLAALAVAASCGLSSCKPRPAAPTTPNLAPAVVKSAPVAGGTTPTFVGPMPTVDLNAPPTAATVPANPAVAIPASAPVQVVAPAPNPAAPRTPAAPPVVIDPMEIIERQVGAAIARVRESAVALEYTSADGARRGASGVVFSDEGDVLSVRIDPPPVSAASPAPSPIVARVASGKRLPASWVAADPETGLTVLKIPPGLARPALPAARGALLGLSVMVVGNPFGLGHSVSRGYVAGLNRRVEYGPRQIGGLIQVDAAIYPGDSGALVADLRGGWIGVLRSGYAALSGGKDRDKDPDRRGRDRDGEHNLGFAIPARDALWVASQLRDHQRVDRAYLGVTMDRNAATPPGEPEGAVLGRVWADSPAERAGLKPGDRVVAIDGQPIRSPYDMTDHLDHTPADAQLTLDLLRGTGAARQYHRIALKSARRPPFEPSRPAPSVASSKNPSTPPKPDDLQGPGLPPRVLETIERLEQRIAELEKQKPDATAQAATPAPEVTSPADP